MHNSPVRHGCRLDICAIQTFSEKSAMGMERSTEENQELLQLAE
jgi:hypothetical protein